MKKLRKLRNNNFKPTTLKIIYQQKALLEFKDIVKNFLFENKGYFELSGNRLLFKKFKEK